MATKIKTLELGEDKILPRTVAKAVTMENGETLEAAIKKIPTDDLKLTADVASAAGLVEGADLSQLLINLLNNTENTLVTAEMS